MNFIYLYLRVFFYYYCCLHSSAFLFFPSLFLRLLKCHNQDQYNFSFKLT